MNIASSALPLHQAVITETVQQIERTGALDDGAAMRSAMRDGHNPYAKAVARAMALGGRLHLQDELTRVRRWAPWIGLALTAIVVIAGLALAGGVTAERQINVMVALASLLGFHLLSLLVWLIGLVLPLGGIGASFGWIWVALTARVAGGKQGQAPALMRAGTQLLARARLLPWTFGLLSHGIWSLSFIAVLGALVFALAFRNYTLSWESTILDPSFFVRGVQWLGLVPSWLGFPVPDAATILAPASGDVLAAGAAGQRAWALWLTGCVLVYGLLPRLAAMVWCIAVWQHRRGAVHPDWNAPYFRKLAARFEAMEPAHIVDGDPGRAPVEARVALPPEQTQDVVLVAGYELPPETAWPPADLPPEARLLRIDGSSAQRRELIDTAADQHPRLLVLVCHAASSPDRGIERLLRELVALCGACRLWPMPADAADSASQARWHRWLADAALPGVEVRDTLGEALAEPRGAAPSDPSGPAA